MKLMEIDICNTPVTFSNYFNTFCDDNSQLSLLQLVISNEWFHIPVHCEVRFATKYFNDSYDNEETFVCLFQV